MWGYLQKSKMLAAPCQKLFGTMVYHTDRARRLALTSPLLLPERVPVVFSIRLFDPPLKRRVFLWAAETALLACLTGAAALTSQRPLRSLLWGSTSLRSIRALRRCRYV